MNILVIEDDKERITQFKSWFNEILSDGDSYTISCDPDEIVDMINKNSYTHIFWDSDLGGQEINGEWEAIKSLMVIKKIRAENGNSLDLLSKQKHIIHSFNDSGVRDINGWLKYVSSNIVISKFNTKDGASWLKKLL